MVTNPPLMIDPYKSKAVTNLRKVSGQIDRVLKMIEQDKYCMDIAQQVNAALGLLEKTNHYVLESHLVTCSEKKLRRGDRKSKELFAEEIMRACNVTSR